jgi:hypothetical protein
MRKLTAAGLGLASMFYTDSYIDSKAYAQTSAVPIYLETTGNDANNGLTPEAPVKTIKRAFQIANSNTDLSQIQIGPGTFSYVSMNFRDFLYNTLNHPLEIKGSGQDQTTLNATIGGFSNLKIEDLTSNGDSTSQLFAVLDNGGYIRNCTLTGYGAVQINPNETVDLTSNTFEDISNPTAVYISPIVRKSSKIISLNVTNNVFRNCSTVFDIGCLVNAGVDGSDGNNVFENCETVVKVADGNPFDQEFMGNYWIDSGAKSQKAITVYTDPAQILSLKVINNGLGTVNVGNALGNPNADNDGDGLFNWQETAVYNSNPDNPDSDSDGFNDGVEVDAGTNPTDPTSIPESPAGLPTNSLEGLALLGAGLGAGSWYLMRRKKE